MVDFSDILNQYQTSDWFKLMGAGRFAHQANFANDMGGAMADDYSKLSDAAISLAQRSPYMQGQFNAQNSLLGRQMARLGLSGSGIANAQQRAQGMQQAMTANNMGASQAQLLQGLADQRAGMMGQIGTFVMNPLKEAGQMAFQHNQNKKNRKAYSNAQAAAGAAGEGQMWGQLAGVGLGMLGDAFLPGISKLINPAVQAGLGALNGNTEAGAMAGGGGGMVNLMNFLG